MAHYALHIPTYEAEVRRMSDEELSEALTGTKAVLNRTPKDAHFNEWYAAFHILRTEFKRRQRIDIKNAIRVQKMFEERNEERLRDILDDFAS